MQSFAIHRDTSSPSTDTMIHVFCPSLIHYNDINKIIQKNSHWKIKAFWHFATLSNCQKKNNIYIYICSNISFGYSTTTTTFDMLAFWAPTQCQLQHCMLLLSHCLSVLFINTVHSMKSWNFGQRLIIVPTYFRSN